MMSVFEHICKTIRKGQIIETPSGRSKFEISQIFSNKIDLITGKSRRLNYISPCMCDEVVGRLVVDCIRNKHGLLIGQPKQAHIDNLYDLFKSNGWDKFRASYVSAIFVEVKIAAYHCNHKRIHIRLLPCW